MSTETMERPPTRVECEFSFNCHQPAAWTYREQGIKGKPLPVCESHYRVMTGAGRWPGEFALITGGESNG